jgi:hypothetical protein
MRTKIIFGGKFEFGDFWSNTTWPKDIWSTDSFPTDIRKKQCSVDYSPVIRSTVNGKEATINRALDSSTYPG